MLRHDPKGEIDGVHRAAIGLAGKGPDRLQGRAEQVGLEDAVPALRYGRNTVEARAGIIVLLGQGREQGLAVFVFAAIDNLWKGSSSQALQNLNLMFGYDETAGLDA